MSEGQHFEVPPKSNDPQSIETLLERGEIESIEHLKGYWGIQLVKIKDDGDAFFRPDDRTDYQFEARGMKISRSDLELMAYKIDQVLEFNLVPAVVNRVVGNSKGSLQRRIQNFQVPPIDWETEVELEEIKRAAIFDYILDVRDRHHGNFLIGSDARKLWLIDHDSDMFFGGMTGSRVIDKAEEQGLSILSEAETIALKRFLEQADPLAIGAKPEIVEIIKKAQDRTKILLKEGRIPTTKT